MREGSKTSTQSLEGFGTPKKSSIVGKAEHSAFEKLLKGVGCDGTYQRYLIGWFMIPLSFLYGLAATNFILIMSSPTHVCHVPGRENYNITNEHWFNMTVPWEEGPDGSMRHSQCQMYNISAVHLEEKFASEIDRAGEISQILHVDSNTTEIVECQHGWQYEKDVWKRTAVSQFDWVCDYKRVVTHMFTLKLIGGALGTLAFAILSDKYGRRPTFYVSLVLCVVFGPAMALSTSLLVFAILLFLYSLSFYTLYQMPFLIVMELCSEKLRSFTVISTFLSFILAVCLVSLIAWLVAEWRIMLLVFHAPLLIFVFYWRYIPESARWLLSQNKVKEFRTVMTKVASVNGREFTPELDFLILKAQEEERKTTSITDIFTEPVLLKHLFLTSLILSVSYMFSVGISLNVHNMTGNIFVNFFVLNLFEIPGNLLGSYLSDFLGRRISSVVLEFLSAASILFAPNFLTNKWGLAICCGVSKMFVGGTILAVYMQVGELFPTTLRATAYGITGIVGISVTVIVPTLMSFATTNKSIPYYILFAFSVVGTIASTFLPETLGLPLPQILKEATSIGKNQSYFSLIYKGNAHKLLIDPGSKEAYEKEHNENVELMSQPN